MEQRRYEDARMDKLELTIGTMKDDLGLVKQKIFNGFSHSIASTEDKVNYIDKQNEKQHGELKESIEKLAGKLDKILFLWVAGSVSIIVAVVGYVVKGII